VAPSTILIAVSALRFLYKVTLHRDWCFEGVIPAPKKPQTLPIVLSPEEVLQFLSCVQSIKHRTILTTCYAAGLRFSEATRLNGLSDRGFAIFEDPPSVDQERFACRRERDSFALSLEKFYPQ
jgi:site-specific recombinase XerD